MEEPRASSNQKALRDLLVPGITEVVLLRVCKAALYGGQSGVGMLRERLVVGGRRSATMLGIPKPPHERRVFPVAAPWNCVAKHAKRTVLSSSFLEMT